MCSTLTSSAFVLDDLIRDSRNTLCCASAARGMPRKIRRKNFQAEEIPRAALLPRPHDLKLQERATLTEPVLRCRSFGCFSIVSSAIHLAGQARPASPRLHPEPFLVKPLSLAPKARMHLGYAYARHRSTDCAPKAFCFFFNPDSEPSTRNPQPLETPAKLMHLTPFFSMGLDKP